MVTPRRPLTPRKPRVAAVPSQKVLARQLLAWYDEHRRPLPWRSTRDPYAIWVSEVMLQQTQVATVIEYYERWMRRFPDIQALADASEEDLLHAWQGLGYYSRARRLGQAARYLIQEHGPHLPRSTQAWLKVPGVGRYTAGAVTSIAFGSMAPVLDGNVMRVLCRLLALRGNPLKAPLHQALWQHAESLLVPERPGDVNQALMELGATVCTPRAPNCALCPWRRQCRSRAAGSSEHYPELPPRPKPTQVTMATAIVRHRGRVLISQATSTARRWASMWMFPCLEVRSPGAAPRALAEHLAEHHQLSVEVGDKLGVFRHAVTRFSIALYAHHARPLAGGVKTSREGVAWARPSELGDYALPAVHRRIAERLE